MARKKRKVPAMNATSSADIAFMLLIFFLITTSMDTDKGLARRLPPPVPKDQKNDTDVDIKKRNLLVVLINSNNQILCGDQFVDIKQLKERIKEFIDNPYNDEHKPERVEADVPFFGKMMVTKNHVISLQNDRGTEYQAYISVQNEQATELQKLEKKSLVTFIYVGKPTRDLRAKMGSETRIQLNDAFAETSEIQDYIAQEKSSMKEEDQPFMTVSIKADKETKMGLITDVKQALREAYALKISYSAAQRVE